MYFILYTSDASEQCSSEDITSILKVSRRNNPSNLVTGLLIYKKPGFLQYLEGPEQAVKALYEKIKNDKRHASIETIKDGEIDARVFPDWEMGFAGEDDLMLLACDESQFGDDLKWEPSRGGALFPHLFRSLKSTDVTWAKPLPYCDNSHRFPKEMV